MNKSPIIFVIVGLVLLVGLFTILKPRPSSQQITPTAETNSKKMSSTPLMNKKTFSMTIVDKKIVSGKTTLKATQGDKIVFSITSDEGGELHLHGYDKSIELQPGKTVSMSFTADIAGQFPYELEESKTDLGTLEVQPK